ncbi:glutathione s-transferase, partial [Rhizoctonia solani]
MAENSFTVLYFAAARTETGVHKEVIPLPPSSPGIPLSQLADLLVDRHPDTKLREVLDISSWSVNEEMVDDDQAHHVVLKGGEEVGVICPGVLVPGSRRNMAATKDSPIILYDLASQNNTPWSPNTYKTRLALIHKGLPFRVEYVSYPDIAPLMQKLGAAPAHPGGKFPYTVPVIADPSSEPGGEPIYVPDSWAISLYLERTYPPPKYPSLFPHGAIAVNRAMSATIGRTAYNAIADTAIALIGTNHILDDRGHEYFMRTREEGFGKPLVELLKEEEPKWSTEIREAWATLGKLLDLNGPMDQVGPFVLGKEISNADFMIAGVLVWLRRAEGPEGHRWKELFEWDGGRWAKIWQAIEELETKSTEV